MQARIGKKRSVTRAWWSSRGALASIITIATFLCLSGCATRKIKNPSLNKSIDSLCLTGQGKGRIEFAKGRHVFSYESLWEPKKNQWSLALGLPLIGQELLRLHLDKKGFDKVVSGTFANRLKNENKSPRTRKLLGQFFGKFVELLKIFETREFPKEDKSKGWQLYQEKDELFAKTQVGKKYQFKLKAFQWDDHFERVRVSMTRVPKGKKERTLLKLDLFVGSCEL